MPPFVRLAALLSVLVFGGPSEGLGAGWKAGVAKAAITPKEPVWMAGYGNRDKPSEGAVHDLWAKALVLEDPSGRKAVLVTLDVCGIDRATSRRLRDAFRQDFGLDDSRVVLACSHTHCGPVVGENLITMYPMDDGQRKRVVAYTAVFEASVRRAVSEAMGRLEPAVLSWETGRADFAVNRRNNKESDVPALRDRGALEGPVDHDVPVLRVRTAGEKLLAVVFGYACHCTVLSVNRFCGDYAGFAQIALERQSPGSQAFFVAGCGGDQNPLPRRSLALAERYGEELAASVRRVVDSPMRPVTGGLTAAYEEIPLRFGPLPTRGQIESDANSSNLPAARRARKLLKTIGEDGRLPGSYPYPVQVWRLGGLTWVLLGGEVVVDYSLRFKRNLGSSRTWVSAYCNDVMAYIPSRRVLKEGGYEGGGAMVYYGLPAPWSEEVEDQVVDAVNRLAKPPQPPTP